MLPVRIGEEGRLIRRYPPVPLPRPLERSRSTVTESDRSLSFTDDFALHYLAIVIGNMMATAERS